MRPLFLSLWEEQRGGEFSLHRKHCFIDCTGLDWSGLDQGDRDIWWKWESGRCSQIRRREGAGYAGWGWGRGDQSGMQPSLRQHKQHADTVTGNIIIILLFKVSLKTSKLYKKEENRFFALMKNTLFVFFFPPTKKILIQENKYSKKSQKII